MIPSIDPYVILVAIIAIFLVLLSILSVIIAIRNNRRKQDRQSSPKSTPNATRSRGSITPAHPDLPRSPVRSSQSLASRSGLAIPSRTTALPFLPSSASHASTVSPASNYDDSIKSDINNIINQQLEKRNTIKCNSQQQLQTLKSHLSKEPTQ